MSWKLIVTVSLATFGLGLCMTNLQKQCITAFNEDFDNDFLVGTWYRVMKFTLFSGMVPTTECPTLIMQKPNSTELKRYKDEYLKPNIPYSFDDNPLHEEGGSPRLKGLVIGKKQAKFFIMDPDSAFFRPPFSVRIYERINEGFILYHECDSRGHMKWLLSRNRNPSSAEVEVIISSRPDILHMQRQWFCAKS